MIKYEYVTVESTGYWCPKIEKYRQIIDKYAKDGYRYAGFVPVKVGYYGNLKSIDLVFEKIEPVPDGIKGEESY